MRKLWLWDVQHAGQRSFVQTLDSVHSQPNSVDGGHSNE